ncbi:MAG: NfeD family protein [Thermodesulfobacteriota bacterium]
MELTHAWLLDPRLIWFIIGLILLLIEFKVPALILLFFGFGAWVVVIGLFIGRHSLNAQLLIFLVSSLIFLALLRKRFKSLLEARWAKVQNLADGLDDFRGRKVMVTKEIKPNLPGRIELHGTNWEAEAEVPVPEGAMVEIVAKNNLTFKVKPI